MNKSNSKNYSSFYDALEKKVLICDGAMGTQLQSRGISGCPDAANIDKDGKEKVVSVHLDYLKAGSDIIQTNTFGANPVKLSSYGLEDKTGFGSDPDVGIGGVGMATGGTARPITVAQHRSSHMGPMPTVDVAGSVACPIENGHDSGVAAAVLKVVVQAARRGRTLIQPRVTHSHGLACAVEAMDVPHIPHAQNASRSVVEQLPFR